MKRLLICILISLSMLPSVVAEEKARHYYFDDVAQFVPTVAIPALKLCGVESKHSWRELIAVTLTSMAICEGVTYTLKYTIHSTRPDGTDRHSFPSGHAARAFQGAEIIRSEYGWGWGAGAYVVAAGVGALRIHHHRHRFGDVVGGAAVGFLSARAAYLLLPVERKLFGWDKTGVTAIVAPMADLQSRCFGAYLSLTL